MHQGTESSLNPTVATLQLARRIFFIPLLVILPVQFAWAAANSYCRDETGDAAKHFGHHEHQHRATEVGASSDTKAASPVNAYANADSDCGMCQLSVAQPVPAASTDAQVPGTDPPRFAYRSRYDSQIPSGPERPDRAARSPAVRFGGAVVIGALLLA